MEREDLIELGVASAETQGPGVVEGDDKIGLNAAGLSDD